MSRQWVRKETNIGDIKKLREAVERMSPGSEIVFDEYLTDQHSNEYCNVNKFYYGAIVENANETYQAFPLTPLYLHFEPVPLLGL